ncbi:hypothetical protein LUZ60_001823 [Juncus effusus]|nr:hypothetical protein LUZ60_001823 [Juncus effusus]
MQKSRKALLQRRASLDKINFVKKKYLYKVSLSVVFLLWILVFLLNSLISYGNGSKDEQQESVVFESISQENNSDVKKPSNYENTPVNFDTNYESTPDRETSLLPHNELTLTEPDNIKEEREREPNQEVERETTQNADGETNQEVEREANQNAERETTQNTARETNQELERETKRELERETLQNVERETNQQAERETNQQSERERENASSQRPDRISRIAPLPLDEFKTKAINSKGKSVNPQISPAGATSVVHRLEPGGKEYNYASLSKGAKILSFNKEAKGASNILDKDKDKYLRNPCSVEGKFVILELSEETLVSTIEIANFEHYSSNLRDFEVFSSLVYPTEIWDKIGGFSANNTKHGQRFGLKEPKWARYLKFNFLSHYGNEFYCTLSSIEVFGVDAVERMLEDLISDEKSKNLISDEKMKNSEDQIENVLPSVSSPLSDESFEREELKSEQNQEDILDEFEIDQENENNNNNKNKVPEQEMRNNNQAGRIQGDTALKVLLQKVQGLDLNFSVLERYLEELNNRYGEIFRDFDDDMASKEREIQKLRSEVRELQMRNERIVNEVGEIKDWKLLVSAQMDKLMTNNQILRSEVEKVKERQKEMENKGLAVVFISFAFGSLAISKLFFGALLRIFRFSCDGKFCGTSSAWAVLLLSCSIISFIMVI